jgi:hypothetical protein
MDTLAAMPTRADPTAVRGRNAWSAVPRCRRPSSLTWRGTCASSNSSPCCSSSLGLRSSRYRPIEAPASRCGRSAAKASTYERARPRLQVAEDMQLTARLSINERPHTVTLLIVEAGVQSHARASLLLRVVSAQPAGYHRQSERIDLAATATLTALVCDRVVPNEQIPAQVTDLSESGARIATPDSAHASMIACICTAASWKAPSIATCA